MARPPRQLELPSPPTWGGARLGAGRPPIANQRRCVPHRVRIEHNPTFPVHLTLRAGRHIPSLRSVRLFGAVRDSIARASTSTFRVTHFSVQHDHVHAIVEADDPARLSRGVSGLVIRTARAINRALDRTGPVWGDRYHARALPTPREVRLGIIYVLQNWRKHLRGARGIDGRSSGPWFDGWRTSVSAPPSISPVAVPRTWLASVGWWQRGGGLIRADESPAPK